MTFPEPVIGLAIEPKTKQDQEKLATALRRLVRRGPDLPRAHRRGDRPDDHLRHGRAAPGDHRRSPDARVQRGRQRRRAAGRLSRDRPQARRQGRRTVRPPDRRSRPVRSRLHRDRAQRVRGRVLFESKIVGGSIPKEYIPAVNAGIKEALECGVVAGYPIVDVKVQLIDGSYHDVDSSEMAFKIAGSMALKEAVKRASPGDPRADDGRRGRGPQGVRRDGRG